MKPDKISRVLFHTNNFRIRFHVPIDEFHKEFTFNDKSYTTLSISSYITMEILNKGKPEIGNSIMVTDKNIFSVITATDKIISNLYNEAIYAMNGDDLIIYSDMAEKHKVIRSLGTGAIMYKPVIVYDTNEVSYEGVMLAINNTANSVELTIDHLEALRYCLTKIDFVAYSQLLINYYQSVYGGGAQANKVTRNKPRPKIVWDQPESTTTATFTRTTDEFGKLIDP